MCEGFSQNSGDKRAGCCITTKHRLTRPFSQGNFLTKNNLTVVPHPPYFSLFPRLKIKLKGSQFDTIGVIRIESQAVLNTLTEHGCQDAF
jgi:hypothetical protein